jgi:hypothetical protein
MSSVQRSPTRSRAQDTGHEDRRAAALLDDLDMRKRKTLNLRNTSYFAGMCLAKDK